MTAYRFAMALTLGCALAAPALADQGVVIYVPPGCDYYAVDSLQGIAVLEWYGGHQPSKDEKIVGEFNEYGFHDVYNEPKLRDDIPNVFRREGIRFEIEALLNYLFIIAAEPVSETEHFVVIRRPRNAEERVAALRALKRDFVERSVGQVDHDVS